jgi:hypothetical protein
VRARASARTAGARARQVIVLRGRLVALRLLADLFDVHSIERGVVDLDPSNERLGDVAAVAHLELALFPVPVTVDDGDHERVAHRLPRARRLPDAGDLREVDEELLAVVLVELVGGDAPGAPAPLAARARVGAAQLGQGVGVESLADFSLDGVPAVSLASAASWRAIRPSPSTEDSGSV